MGFFDSLLGRTKPVEANLEALFGLPGAIITLQASQDLEPTNVAGVCYKPMAGQRFARTSEEMSELLGLAGSGDDAPGGFVRQEEDKYGYHWVVVGSGDFQTLVNQIHVVNTTLEEDGYGPQLLCSVFGFRPSGAAPGGEATVYLVYLYKRGTFYPFMPLGPGERRDVETELVLQVVLKDDLRIEPEKERWMPLWGLPVH
jgi:hypothetical protein